MKANVVGLDGRDVGEIELPMVFETPYRPEVIHKVYVNLLSHSYQRQGRYPAAGEMVSAQSRNTGLGIARVARAQGRRFPESRPGRRCRRRKTRKSCTPARTLEDHLQENQSKRKTARPLFCNSGHCQKGPDLASGPQDRRQYQTPSGCF